MAQPRTLHGNRPSITARFSPPSAMKRYVTVGHPRLVRGFLIEVAVEHVGSDGAVVVRSAVVSTPGGPLPASIAASLIHSRSTVAVRSRTCATSRTLRSPIWTKGTVSALYSDVNDRRFLRTINTPGAFSRYPRCPRKQRIIKAPRRHGPHAPLASIGKRSNAVFKMKDRNKTKDTAMTGIFTVIVTLICLDRWRAHSEVKRLIERIDAIGQAQTPENSPGLSGEPPVLLPAGENSSYPPDVSQRANAIAKPFEGYFGNGRSVPPGRISSTQTIEPMTTEDVNQYFENEFMSQPIDLSWAPQITKDLRADIDAAMPNDGKVASFECRSTFCRLEVVYGKARDHHEFMGHLTSDPDSAIGRLAEGTYSRMVTQGTGEESRFVLYIGRKGTSLVPEQLLQ